MAEGPVAEVVAEACQRHADRVPASDPEVRLPLLQILHHFQSKVPGADAVLKPLVSGGGEDEGRGVIAGKSELRVTRTAA